MSAKIFDWQRRFGKTAPTSSVVAGDHRLIVLNGKFDAVPKELTYHDYLVRHAIQVFGKTWFEGQSLIDSEQRHPVVQWLEEAGKFKIDHAAAIRARKAVRATGTVGHLITFCHELWAFENNGLLRPEFIDRLKDAKQFQGARYELQVANICLRAGFTIDLIDESENSSTHCEFNITDPRTKKQFSVEAKSRHRRGVLGFEGKAKPAEDLRPQVKHHLNKALSKCADNFRLIFLDLNLPPSPSDWKNRSLVNDILEQIEQLKGERAKAGLEVPSAFVIFTNRPAHFVSESDLTPDPEFLALGLAIPEMNASQGGSKEALANKYPEIVPIFDALSYQCDVPDEFEMPRTF